MFKTSFFCLLLLNGCVTLMPNMICAQIPAPAYRLQTTQLSPRGDISVDQFALVPGVIVEEGVPGYQLWVVDRNQRDARRKLFESNWSSHVRFSADEYYLLVEQTTGKSSSRLAMFRRREGLQFVEIENLDKLLWDYCLKLNPEAGDLTDNRRESHIIAWGSDNSSLLVSLGGEGSQGRLQDWLVACDIGKSSPTLDLNILNRGWPQAQNLPENALEQLPLAATDHTNRRLTAAFELLTGSGGGLEQIPQPGDIIPPRISHAARTTPTPTPLPFIPKVQKLRGSMDGTALLYELNQSAAGKQAERDWFCIFDMNTGRPSMDLQIMNREAIDSQIQ